MSEQVVARLEANYSGGFRAATVWRDTFTGLYVIEVMVDGQVVRTSWDPFEFARWRDALAFAFVEGHASAPKGTTP